MNARVFLAASALLAAAGCGTYRDAPERTRRPAHVVATYGAVAYAPRQVVVVQQQPAAQQLIVVEAPAAGPPPAAAPPPAPPPPVRRHLRAGEGTIVCSGNERIRLTELRLGGPGTPAVVASGNCVVEVSESILQGEPAIVVSDHARVVLVECRIEGDILSGGRARVVTRGSAHRGRLLPLG